MGGRDHSCEGCGRGGFNDPDGQCVCPGGDGPTWEIREGDALERATCPSMEGTAMKAPKNVSEPADVETLIEAVKEAKRRQDIYAAAQASLGAAVDRIRDLIGGDGLAAISNGERRIGEILTRAES